MLQLFSKFSGILAIFVAWLFVVGPALHYGIDSKSETITTATMKNKKVLEIVSFGLILGAFLQGIFLLYLIQKFRIPFLSIGSLMYLTSNVATILVALFHYEKYPKMHEMFAEYYFVISPLSLGFIGFSAMKSGSGLFVFSLFVVILYFIGLQHLLKRYKNKNALLEFWAFLMLSIWTIVFTVV